MARLKDWIKAHWLSAAAIAIGLIITVWAVGRACKVEDNYSRLKGAYQAYRTINSAANELMKEDIADKEKKIVQLDRQVAILNTDVKRLKTSLTVKDRALVELEGLFTTLPDIESKLFNMTQQRDAWRDKFMVADAIISNQGQQIDLLNLKCGELEDVARSFRAMYDNELVIRLASENAMRACATKLKSASFWSGAKNIVIGVAAGYVIYQAVK